MIKVAFVGDIMPGGMFFYEGGISEDVLDILHQSDLRIGTLETAMGDGHVLCHLKNTPELGTIIYSPDDTISMLLNMNVNAVSLANNHACDCDLEGLYHMMELLDQHGITHFGAGHNAEEAARPGVLEVGGKTICLLGYLKEYSYFYRGEGYVPTETVGGINLYNFSKAKADVKKYKAQFDYVFVMPHWGKEGSLYPIMQEVKEARTLVEAGADGVIASHAHIVQPIVHYKKGIIAMNLGNFAFPDRYIDKPRITVYPSKNDIQKESIPQVESFKIVDCLTYKKVAEPERKGTILQLNIKGKTIKKQQYFTKLVESNVVERRKKIAMKEMLLLNYVGLFIKDKTSILHKVHNKLISIR